MDGAMGQARSAKRCGIFTVSLDFELIWGTLDKSKWEGFRSICQTERDEVVGRLLEMFEAYDVSATWCTVGHLFLDRCDCAAHPLAGERGVRYLRDPGTDERTDPIFYGRDLIRQIQQCRTPQEIGCHSFMHADFATCSRERADAELAACVSAAAGLGIQLRSFVFPRNRIGHLDLLPKYGFTVFRGPDPTWHESASVRGWRHRAGHLLDVTRAAQPPVVEPEWDEAGLWNVRGSMLYTPSYGFRRHIPVSLRVLRAKKGLQRAVERGQVFHLWFHPTDVVVRQREMLDGLRQIFETAQELRSAKRLEILPMADVPARYEPAHHDTGHPGEGKPTSCKPELVA